MASSLTTVTMQSIRIVSNLNGMPDSANGYFEDSDVEDTDEDLKFLMYVDADRGQRYIVRYEKNGSNQTTVLANRIDSLVFRYYDEKVTYSTTVDSDGVATSRMWLMHPEQLRVKSLRLQRSL